MRLQSRRDETSGSSGICIGSLELVAIIAASAPPSELPMMTLPSTDAAKIFPHLRLRLQLFRDRRLLERVEESAGSPRRLLGFGGVLLLRAALHSSLA
jgi:hypothetical protein